MNESRSHGVKVSQLIVVSLIKPTLYPDTIVRDNDGQVTSIVDFSHIRQACLDTNYLTGLIARYGEDYTLGTLRADLTDLIEEQAKRL